jgi:hypothetical protein
MYLRWSLFIVLAALGFDLIDKIKTKRPNTGSIIQTSQALAESPIQQTPPTITYLTPTPQSSDQLLDKTPTTQGVQEGVY